MADIAKPVNPCSITYQAWVRKGHFHIKLVGDVATFRVSFSSKNSRRGQNLRKNSRTGISEQVKLGIKALLLAKTETSVFDFPRTVTCFKNIFPEQGQKLFRGRHLPIYISAVIPLPPPSRVTR